MAIKTYNINGVETQTKNVFHMLVTFFWTIDNTGWNKYRESLATTAIVLGIHRLQNLIYTSFLAWRSSEMAWSRSIWSAKKNWTNMIKNSSLWTNIAGRLGNNFVLSFHDLYLWRSEEWNGKKDLSFSLLCCKNSSNLKTLKKRPKSGRNWKKKIGA